MTLKISSALIALLLSCTVLCTVLHAQEGTVPRFDYGLEEGVQTVPPLTHALVGTQTVVLDDKALPYGATLAADLAELGDPGTFYNASVVKVGSNYYIWAHQGWHEAGCEDTPDFRDQSGDNVLIYKSPHPDVIWPASGQGTAKGFYPSGCTSATCNGAIQRGELRRSLGTDYKTNDVCPTKNHTGMGSIARIGTTSSYVVFFDNTDDDLHQIDPVTGLVVNPRDFECAESCLYEGLDTHCQKCEGGAQFEPECSNSNNTDPFFDHWALWRPLFNLGNGTSFDGNERVAFNGRTLKRVFIDPVPFTIPGDNGAVGFLVRSAKAGWCENFRDSQLHYGYVLTGANPTVHLLMPNGSYLDVTGKELKLTEMPEDVNPSGADKPKINDIEAVSTNGANAFVAYESRVRNGNAGQCGTYGIGSQGPRNQQSQDNPIHTELRYRAFKLNGRQWGGWASDDIVELGSKPPGTPLWQISPFSWDGPVGASFPDVLRDGATTRLYYTQDTDCTGTFLKDDIAHVELRTNVAWDSGFRESQAATAPLVVYPGDFAVTYPNQNVPPDAVFIDMGSLGIFGSTVDKTDRKWTVMNDAMASSQGGSFSCVHGWQNEKLLRIVVALTGAVPGASYDVYVDYMVDGSLTNGRDGLDARLGGGTIYEFSDVVAGPSGQYATIEVAEPSTLEIRRALLGTKVASSTGKIGNIAIDNEFSSATPRFSISRFCGLYVERR